MAKNKKEEQGLPISAMELEQPWPPVLFRGFSAFTTEESVAITAATNPPADFTGFSPQVFTLADALHLGSFTFPYPLSCTHRSHTHIYLRPL